MKNNNSVLFIGYDRPVTGREMAAIDVIENLTKLLERAHQEKKIESFDTVSLSVHGGDMNGFMLVRGTRENLDEICKSEEFDALSIKGHMTMEGVRILSGVYGEAVIARRMERIKQLMSSGFC